MTSQREGLTKAALWRRVAAMWIDSFAVYSLAVFVMELAALTATGVLCLLGGIGPIAGDMAIQRIGTLGYGVALPITCIILALVFRHGAESVYPNKQIQPTARGRG